MTGIILSLSTLMLIHLCIFVSGIRKGLPIFDRSLPFASRIGECEPGVESFDFPSADGHVLLKASILNPARQCSRGVVVFCHELGGNRWTARHYCEGLLEAGFTVVAFDFSQHGDSEKRDGYARVKWLTEHDVNDVIGAVEFVQTQSEWSDLPLFLFGVSKGGGAALGAAARLTHLSGVVVESAYSTRQLTSLHATRWLEYALGRRAKSWVPRWHIDYSLQAIRWLSQRRHHCRYAELERDLASLRGTRVFWLSGARDTYVRPSVIHELCEIAGGDPATDVWIVPDARHNSARHQNPAEYDRRIVEFLENTGALVCETEAAAPLHRRVLPTAPRHVSSQPA